MIAGAVICFLRGRHGGWTWIPRGTGYTGCPTCGLPRGR